MTTLEGWNSFLDQWRTCSDGVACSDLWFEVNCLLVSKDIYNDIYTEREELLFSLLGKCINQLLFLRTGIVKALANILCTKLNI